MLTVANVIFPAFYAPYVVQVLLPFLAIVALSLEVLFYRRWCGDKHLGPLIGITVAANLVSSVVGIVTASYFPTGYSDSTTWSSGSWRAAGWHELAVLGWVVAFVISVIVEAAVIRAMKRLVNIRRPLLAASYANALSYGTLAVVLILPSVRR